LSDVSDFEPVQSSADAVIDEPVAPVPTSGSAASAPIAESAPTLELAEGDGIPAPQLVGKTVREVTEQCLKLGLTPVLVGTGVATAQSPEPGETIRRGNRITIQFARSASLLSASARGKAK
jgi:hypothetical protein